MSSRRIATVLPLVVLLVSCASDNPNPTPTAAPSQTATGSTGASPTTPTDLDGCVTAAEATLLLDEGTSTSANVALMGTGDVGVVISYETSRIVCRWLPLAERLVAAGYQVLLYDVVSGTATEHVIDRVALLRDRGVERVALVGGSLGGTASIRAAIEIAPPVVAVVNLSGGSPEAVAAAGSLVVPLLQMVAQGDASSIGVARDIDAAATVAPVHELVELTGTAHASAMFTSPDAELVLSTIVAFLEEHAPPN